jgi:hypothetical protein
VTDSGGGIFCAAYTYALNTLFITKFQIRNLTSKFQARRVHYREDWTTFRKLTESHPRKPLKPAFFDEIQKHIHLTMKTWLGRVLLFISQRGSKCHASVSVPKKLADSWNLVRAGSSVLGCAAGRPRSRNVIICVERRSSFFKSLLKWDPRFSTCTLFPASGGNVDQTKACRVSEKRNNFSEVQSVQQMIYFFAELTHGLLTGLKSQWCKSVLVLLKVLIGWFELIAIILFIIFWRR